MVRTNVYFNAIATLEDFAKGGLRPGIVRGHDDRNRCGRGSLDEALSQDWLDFYASCRSILEMKC